MQQYICKMNRSKIITCIYELYSYRVVKGCWSGETWEKMLMFVIFCLANCKFSTATALVNVIVVKTALIASKCNLTTSDARKNCFWMSFDEFLVLDMSKCGRGHVDQKIRIVLLIWSIVASVKSIIEWRLAY